MMRRLLLGLALTLAPSLALAQTDPPPPELVLNPKVALTYG